MERFWKKVEKTEGCWNWTAHRNALGYGTFRTGENVELAHRVSYRMAGRLYDESLCVLHRCDNPRCVNPDHLWLGTRVENNQDREDKGRGVRCPGERNGRCKLSTSQVEQLRSMYDAGWLIIPLAKEFNISKSQVWHIVSGAQRALEIKSAGTLG